MNYEPHEKGFDKEFIEITKGAGWNNLKIIQQLAEVHSRYKKNGEMKIKWNRIFDRLTANYNSREIEYKIEYKKDKK